MAGDKNDEPYSLPHGSEENVRLDAQHEAIVSLIGDKPFHAPITAPTKILDVGCGSGVATLELAKRFPDAHIVGIDVAPVELQSWHPSNVSFLQGTFASLVRDGALQEGSFDYVFQRMLVMGIVDWQSHTDAAVRLLKPGGWLEMQDLDWHVYDRNEKQIDDRYPHNRAIQAASEAKGLDPFCGKHLDAYMRGAGLSHIASKHYPFAWTYWRARPETKLIAAHNQSPRHIAVRSSLLDKLVGSSGMYSDEEIESFKRESETCYQQAKEGTHKGYGVAFGQKMR